MQNYKELKVWEKAHSLTLGVYKATQSFPSEEKFGLISQLRRASSSIPANIAEGAARSGTKELLLFLSIASGSLSELDTHIEIATRLGLIKDHTELSLKIDKVFALLVGLSKSLKNKIRD